MFSFKYFFKSQSDPEPPPTAEEIYSKLESRSALEICLRLRKRAKFLKERAESSPYDSLVKNWGTSRALDEVAALKILELINDKRTQAGLTPLTSEDLDRIEEKWTYDLDNKTD